MATKPRRPCQHPGCPSFAVERGRCRAHQIKRETEKAQAARLYDDHRGSSAARGYGYAWQQLRAHVLSVEPICRGCRARRATEVDHIIPLRRGGTHDLPNLQPLCRHCHRSKTRRESQRTTPRPIPTMGRSMIPVTVVCGPPGSGKTTYVHNHAHRGDLILDLDAIFAALSGLATYDKPDALLPFVFAARDAIIARLAQHSDVRHAWIITSGADAAQRDQFAHQLGAEVVVLDVDPSECLRRIEADPERHGKRPWARLVREWWETYRRTIEAVTT